MRAVDRVLTLAGGEVVDEVVIAYAALAVGGRHDQLFDNAKARDAGELDQIAPVARLGELGDAADTAHAKEMWPRFGARGAWMRGVGLDHADQAMGEPERIVDHRMIDR